MTAERPAPPVGVDRVIPQATVTRLATYLRVLGIYADDGVLIVSSEELANSSGVGSAKLRKDLSFLGPNGVRGVGYDVTRLRAKIESALGLDRGHKVVLVGIGNLGRALARYGGFGRRGFSVVGLFDRNPERIGTELDGLVVRDVRQLAQCCRELEATIGVVATPDESAQAVASAFVLGGVECILSFSPVVLDVPDTVEVRRVDLAVEMQVLSFNSSRNGQSARNDLSAGNGHSVPAAAPALPATLATALPRPARLGRSRGPRVVPTSSPSANSSTSTTRNGSVIAP